MKFSDYKNILKGHRLRITDCRVDVLDKFYRSNHALSFNELEHNLKEYDRVTLYRTINSFVEKGILHRIPNDNGNAAFGLCPDSCTTEAHNHNHIHFKCERCGHIECLTNVDIPKISLPGYQVLESNLIISGICQVCNGGRKNGKK